MPSRTFTKKRNGKRILAALMSHRTITAAAKSLGMDRQAIYTYLRAHPEVQAEWENACCDIADQACATLAKASVDAAEMVVGSVETGVALNSNMLRTLEFILERATEFLRLKALQKQIDALKAQLNGQSEQTGAGNREAIASDSEPQESDDPA